VTLSVSQRVLALVVVLVAASVVAFFDPTLAVVAVASFVLGLVARPALRRGARLIRLMRDHPKRAAAGIIAGMALILLAALIAALALLAAHPKGGGVTTVVRSEDTAPYRAQVRYASRSFAVREQYIVDRSLVAETAPAFSGRLTRASHAPTLADVRRVSALFKQHGWRLVATQNQRLVFERDRRSPHRPTATWPLRTTLKFTVPEPALVPADELRRGVTILPDDSSTVTLIAGSGVVHRTVPEAVAEPIENKEEQFQISLNSHGGFPTDRVIIETNSPLARNPVVEKLLTLTFWTPLQVALSLLCIVLGDVAKERLKRVLRLGNNNGGQTAAPVPSGQSGAAPRRPKRRGNKRRRRASSG
jgi:hypothetical protein